MRKGLTLVLCLALLLGLAMPAQASTRTNVDYGYTIEGWYSETSQTQYGFIIDETEVGYNGEVPYYWYYDEIWTGSAIYVPVGYLDNNGREARASFKSLGEKNGNVTVSHKATTGSEYVQSVTLVDGNKEKVDGLPNGAYAKIQLSDSYSGTGNGVKIVLNFGLSVRGVYYQETDTQLTVRMMNPLVFINRNTVYGAQSPTQFESNYYNGEVTFDMGGGVRYTTTVSSGGKYVINLSRAANANIAAMYPGDHLEYLNFRGNNDTFASTGRLEIPIDTSKFRTADGTPVVYAYLIDGSTLRAIDTSSASYNSTTKVLTLSTQTLGNYVLANRALIQNVTEGRDADGTFRSGYAQQQAAETSQVDAQQQEDGVVATQAETASPADAEVQPESATQPEATSGSAANANDNADTGRVINAANPPGDNPSTGPQGMLGLMLALCVAAGGAGAVYWKKAKPFARKDDEAA